MEEKKLKHNHFVSSFMLAVGSGSIYIFEIALPFVIIRIPQ